MRQVKRHQRREAVAPIGDGIQCLSVGGLIGIEHQQMRTDGAGIGERQADLQTEIGCGIIQRGNLQRVVLLGDDDAGMIISQRDVAAPLMRSVGRRGSHRLRIRRRFTEKALHHISIP